MPRVIHHKDGDPTSVDLANLQVVTLSTCHHCHQPIEHDGGDSWKHLSGFYSCLELGGWNQAAPEADL